jgi:predicted methyltransferase
MMRWAAVALALSGLPAFAQAAPKPPAVETVGATDAMNGAIDAALNAPDRSMEHRLRDENRNVRVILKAAWPKDTAGDPNYTLTDKRVLDVGAGGAYLALIFSALVGETGHVDIHNTPGWINQFPGMDPDAQRRWIRRANVGWITEPWNGIAGEPGSYDIVVMGQVYHDALLEGAIIPPMNKALFDLLKPGGRLIVEDHDAIDTQTPAQQANLHRISHELVTELFTEAGFQLERMELNDSRYDDRRMNVFFPGVRGRTDRFVAVFVKPAG